jgi:hypothetical protein
VVGVRVGAAADRDPMVDDAMLVRAVGLVAGVELVADGRVAVDEAPTTEGLGLTGVAVFAAGAAGRALTAERTLLVDDARVDLLSAGFVAVAPGRVDVAVVPVARFVRPLAGFFSSPDANVPGPSWSDAEALVEVVNRRGAAAVVVPVVGRVGGLFKLLPSRDEVAAVLVRELRDEAVGLVAVLPGIARFGAAAVARLRFGGTFSNLFTAAATDPAGFATDGDLGADSGGAVSEAVSGAASGSGAGSAAAGASMGAAAAAGAVSAVAAAAVSASAIIVVGICSYRKVGGVQGIERKGVTERVRAMEKRRTGVLNWKYDLLLSDDPAKQRDRESSQI